MYAAVVQILNLGTVLQIRNWNTPLILTSFYKKSRSITSKIFCNALEKATFYRKLIREKVKGD